MGTAVHPHARGAAAFDTSGIERGEDGIARYVDRPASLLEMLRTSVERSPQATAIVEDGGPSLSYRELWDRSARVAGGLRGEGVERGDRVAIRLGNGADWVLAFWGAVMAGAVVVPVNMRFKEAEADYVVEDSGSRFVFASGRALPDGEPSVVEDLEPDELAAIFYTSGTTGFPKGAMTSHANFLANSETANRVIAIDRDMGSDLRTLVSVPLFHVTGCNSQLIPVLELGGVVEIMTAPDVGQMLEVMARDKLNMHVSVPALWFAAINHPRFSDYDFSH